MFTKTKLAVAMLAAPAAIAAMALSGGTAQAATTTMHPASVVGSLYDENGTAGWYTQSFGTDYSKADATFTLTDVGSKLPADANGTQLCNSEDGSVLQVGAVATQAKSATTPALYTIGYGFGNLTSDPTGDGDACNGNTFLPEGTFTGMVNDVPAGHSIRAEVQVVTHEFGSTGPAGVFFRAEDVTNSIVNFNVFKSFATLNSETEGGLSGPFNEAGSGVSADELELSAPASNDLTDFSNVTATTVGGLTDGYAVWDAVSVSSSADGLAPALLTPTLISPSVYTRTWHPGHRYYYGKKHHRHYRWIKGYWSSTGSGPSSFSVDGGSETGL